MPGEYTESYFEDWGTKKNPVRQSDMKSLYGGMFSCPKKFALSKLYPAEDRDTTSYKAAMGNVVHKAIENFLFHQEREQYIKALVKEYERKNKIKVEFDDKEKNIARYQEMYDNFMDSKFAKNMKKRLIDVERAFLVEIGGIWVAGTIDVILKGKGGKGALIVDWKTGNVMSQFEMDHGYQTAIYLYAVEKGEFYLKPQSMASGYEYYKSYKKTMQKNTYPFRKPKMMYAFLKEMIPAKRSSVRKCAHVSSRKMANDAGNIAIEKGSFPGPVFYETFPLKTDIDRLEQSLKVATIFAQNMVFPENISQNCERCFFQQKCLSLGSFGASKQEEIWDMIEEAGIELE